jgi:hypothetical protein
VNIYAGKATTSRYDHRAPIHLAVGEIGSNTARAICGGISVSPISQGPAIDVTCRRCKESLATLPDLLSDPEASSARSA